MPTIDEKLMTMNKLILDGATKSRDSILGQLRQDADRKLADQKADIDRRADEEYRREMSRAVQEREARVSLARINTRKQLMMMRNELLASVLADLKTRFAAFTETEEYRGCLIRNVRECLSRDGLAGGNPTSAAGKAGADAIAASHSGLDPQSLKVYLTPRDYDLYAAEIGEMSRDISVLRGGADMIGGCRVEHTGAGVYIDNTFNRKVEQSVDELFRISGLSIGG